MLNSAGATVGVIIVGTISVMGRREVGHELGDLDDPVKHRHV